MKTKKKLGGGGREEWVGLGGQGGCERRIEVFVKIPMKKNKKLGWGLVWGGQGGCERRIEAFVKSQKKMGGGVREGWVGGRVRGWGVRVDVNEELKFL